MAVKRGGLLLVGVENSVAIIEPFAFGGVSVSVIEPFNFGDVTNVRVSVIEPFNFGANVRQSVVEPFDFGSNLRKSVIEPFDFGSSGGDRGGVAVDVATGQPLAPLMGYRDR